MDQGMAGAAGKVSRIELAPPRRFALPAVLLLLSERPGYGYELVARLSTKPGIHAVHLTDGKATAAVAKAATETG